MTAYDYYQLFVGEIGMSRHEFLYEVDAWEANLINEGYLRRNALFYQLLRINAWASAYCMGNPEKVGPQDFFHLYVDDLKLDEQHQGISKEDYDQLQQEMRDYNQRIKNNSENADKN